MIHILPYLEERISSGKTPEDIYTILRSVTDSRKMVVFPEAEFIGQVNPFDFRICPRIIGRNSFRPILTGSILQKEEGTIIEITLQMHSFTCVLMSIWIGMLCFFLVCGIPVVFAGGQEGIILILTMLGFLIFSQTLMRCSFYGLAGKALKRLKELLCQ